LGKVIINYDGKSEGYRGRKVEGVGVVRGEFVSVKLLKRHLC
jgi:hypothetical protein